MNIAVLLEVRWNIITPPVKCEINGEGGKCLESVWSSIVNIHLFEKIYQMYL